MWGGYIKALHVVSCSAADRVELCEVVIFKPYMLQAAVLLTAQMFEKWWHESLVCCKLQCCWSYRCMWGDDKNVLHVVSCSAADRVMLCEGMILKPYMLQAAVLLTAQMFVKWWHESLVCCKLQCCWLRRCMWAQNWLKRLRLSYGLWYTWPAIAGVWVAGESGILVESTSRKQRGWTHLSWTERLKAPLVNRDAPLVNRDAPLVNREVEYTSSKQRGWKHL